MKRLFALLTLVGFLAVTNSIIAVAQNDTTADTEQAYADATVISYDPNMQDDQTVSEEDPFANAGDDDLTFHQRIKEKFIEGGWEFLTKRQLV